MRTVGRASKGVRIMDLKKNDKIAGVAKIIKVEGDNAGENKEENSEAPVSAPEAGQTVETPPADTADE